ncbi:sca1 complex scaffold protein scaa [Anaeramoeba ignava]|uniref:Sca1 complex scaffold protein scaa n=1 Tax=Anaeramoeba ignava TaxID=1746090 RepID=A0A9Q0LPB9_ANAIG|nr:sca1 complex scaffold protein scaa [Anaeramoeba ignava]
MSKRISRIAKEMQIKRQTMSSQSISDFKNQLKFYQTNDQKNYLAPLIDSFFEHQEGIMLKYKNVPFYISPDGKIYDLYYHQIYSKDGENSQEFRTTSENYYDILLQQLSPHDLENIPNFPDFSQCNSYSEFEEKAIQWKEDILQRLGFIKLPRLLGRTYPRPKFHEDKIHKYFESDEKIITDFSSPRDSSDANKSGKLRTSLSSVKNDFDENEPDYQSEKEIRSESTEEKENRSKMVNPSLRFYDGTDLLIRQNESWKNYLIPPTPKAQYYLSYEEFEEAYYNWGQIVLSQLPQIPPHPKNFEEMYGFLTGEERIQKIQKRMLKESQFDYNKYETKLKKKIIRLNWYDLWRKKIERNTLFYSISFGHGSKIGFSNIFADLKQNQKQNQNQNLNLNENQNQNQNQNQIKNQNQNQNEIKNENQNENQNEIENQNQNQNQNQLTESKKEIYNFLDKIYSKIKNNIHDFNSISKPILGQIYGKIKTNEIEYSKKYQQKINLPLRRTGLTENLLNESYQIPIEMKKEDIDFSFPDYDLSLKIEYSQIHDPKYLQKIQSELNTINENAKLDEFKYLTNANKYSKKNLQIYKQKIDKLTEAGTPLTVEELKEVFHFNIGIDQLSNFLLELVLVKYQEQTISSFFQLSVTKENFSQILNLFYENHSLEFHFRFSQFISELVQTNLGRSLINHYLNNHEVLNLYYIAYSVNMTDNNPQPIFPYSKLIQILCKIKNKNSILDQFENIFFINYYLSIIQSQMTSESQMFSFVSGSNEITKKMKQFTSIMIDNLKNNSNAIINNLFEGINSRSTLISEYYAFILRKLFLYKNGDIEKILMLDESKLFENIRKLGNSKYSHSQQYCQVLWRTLISNNKWLNFLTEKYSKNYQFLILDIYPPNKIENENEFEVENKHRLMNLLLCQFLKTAFDKIDLKKKKKKKLTYDLLRAKLFFDLLSQCEYHVTINYFTETLIFMTKIMKIMAKKFRKISAISTEMPTNIDDFDLLNSYLFISLDHLKIIISIILKLPKNLSQAQKNLVSFFRNLFARNKFSRFFFGLSEYLWELIYKLILYHNGFIGKLIQNNQLNSVIELISPSYHISVVVYGLEHFKKIFNMVNEERNKIKLTKKPSRNKHSLKTIEKDIKSFIDYFEENSFFVTFHMILKSCISSEDRRFINLAEIYNIILTNPSCSKILTQVNSREHYKFTFDFLTQFFKQGYKLKYNKKTKGYSLI